MNKRLIITLAFSISLLCNLSALSQARADGTDFVLFFSKSGACASLSFYCWLNDLVIFFYNKPAADLERLNAQPESSIKHLKQETAALEVKKKHENEIEEIILKIDFNDKRILNKDPRSRPSKRKQVP